MLTYAQPTRFDLRFSILNIPVRVHPLFWLVAFLLGGRTINLLDILAWIVAVFISVLVHELGHALAMRYYGQRAHIVLHAMGGLTVPESFSWGTSWATVRLSPNQEIVVTAAGPFTGFLFAGLIVMVVLALGGVAQLTTQLGFIPIPLAGFTGSGALFNSFIGSLLWINVMWGVFNLIPVYPLDGGQIARHALLQVDPYDGARKSIWLSVIAGGAMAAISLVFLGSVYMALLFALLAFQSYQMLTGGTLGY